MRIVIDADYSAAGYHIADHVIHLDSLAGNVVADPAGGALPVQVLVAMTHFNATPAARATGGWGILNQLPGEAAPMTRWARLVAAANAATADPAVKALALSGV